MWHRISDYQLVSLKMIASSMLLNSPKYSQRSSLAVFIPGELNPATLVFDSPVYLTFSQFNPGAADAVAELRAHFPTIAGAAELKSHVLTALLQRAKLESQTTSNGLEVLPDRPAEYMGLRSLKRRVIAAADTLGLDGSIGYDGSWAEGNEGRRARYILEMRPL